MKRIFDFYEDEGHGWLRVPRNMLIELGIECEISSYSYQKGEDVYLEEDRDMSIFLAATRQKGFLLEFREHYSRCSRIRSYNPFCHAKID